MTSTSESKREPYQLKDSTINSQLPQSNSGPSESQEEREPYVIDTDCGVDDA